MRRSMLLLLGVALIPACSWSRYDELTKDPPVVLIERPSSVAARFGASLAAGDGVLLAGGQAAQAGFAVFEIADPPSPTPLTSTCTDLSRCRSSATPAHVGSLSGKSKCFVVGVGKGDESLGDGPSGLVGTCVDGGPFRLAVPESFRLRVADPVLVPFALVGFEGVVALASADGLIGAASPETRDAWLYGPDGAGPTIVERPAYAMRTYGTTVAMVGGATPTFAVAAPAGGQVVLHDPATGALRGCLRGPTPWGVVMTGFVDGGKSWLAISNGAGKVDVVDLAAVKLDPASCVEPGDAARAMTCAATADVDGCDGAAFGYSLAHGDLDGDGDQELLVGAPGANVRSVPNAGAVFVFDLEGATTPHEALFISSAVAEDQLGGGVAAVRVGAHDVVAAGAPGTLKSVALFFCAMSSGPRCQ